MKPTILTDLVALLAYAAVIVLPMISTTSQLNFMPRLGFGRWYWGTLPVAVGIATLIGSWTRDGFGLAAMPLAFHAQWAVLNLMHRQFVEHKGHEPRNVFMRRWHDAPDTVPDRIYGVVSLVSMFACAMLIIVLFQVISRTVVQP